MERLEEGRKWKYYVATNKARSLFTTDYYKFVITLGIFVISVGLTFILSLQKSATFIAEKSEGIIGEAVVVQKTSLLMPLLSIISLIALILAIRFWFKYRKSPFRLIR